VKLEKRKEQVADIRATLTNRGFTHQFANWLVFYSFSVTYYSSSYKLIQDKDWDEYLVKLRAWACGLVPGIPLVDELRGAYLSYMQWQGKQPKVEAYRPPPKPRYTPNYGQQGKERRRQRAG